MKELGRIRRWYYRDGLTVSENARKSGYSFINTLLEFGFWRWSNTMKDRRPAMQHKRGNRSLFHIASRKSALAVLYIVLCLGAAPAEAILPYIIRFLPRAVVAEEAAAVRGAMATARERSIVQEAARNSPAARGAKRYRADTSWIEREVSKQVVDKILNSMDPSIRPNSTAIHSEECLLVNFDGYRNLLINRCDFSIEIGQGWMAVNNAAEIVVRFGRILAQAGVPIVNPNDNRIDDVASYKCDVDCVYGPGESKHLRPALFSGQLTAYPPSGPIVIDLNAHYPPIELIGPIVAFQYRRI